MVENFDAEQSFEQSMALQCDCFDKSYVDDGGGGDDDGSNDNDETMMQMTREW